MILEYINKIEYKAQYSKCIERQIKDTSKYLLMLYDSIYVMQKKF